VLDNRRAVVVVVANVEMLVCRVCAAGRAKRKARAPSIRTSSLCVGRGSGGGARARCEIGKR
jgi:hypothetical protein